MKNSFLNNQFTSIGLSFDDIFYTRCEKFKSLLKEWGKVHNLTSPASLNDSDIETNIVDSIYPLSFIDEFDSFADVGTGAGYPGLLLAIARPDIRCALIEPRAKRAAFLNYAKNILGLKNITIIQKRVEDVKDLTFDLITSRAVTNTNLLLNITQDISNKESSYLFYKGSICSEELQDLDLEDTLYTITEFGEHRNYLYIKGRK